MKMDTTQFIRVTDMVLITLIMNGITRKLNFLIGDSFTHGACVNRPEDIASNLRLLSNDSVLNLGYGGNGPLIEYATLKEYLLPNVEMVFWIYLEGNDLYNLNNELKNKILVNYLNDLSFTQNLKFKQSEIDKVVKTIVKKEILNETFQLNKDDQLRYKIIKFIRLNNLKKFIKKRTVKNKVNKFEDKIFKEFKDILKLSKEFTTKNNSKLYFVYLQNIIAINQIMMILIIIILKI